MNFLWLSRCGSQLKLYSFGRKTFFIGITRNNHMFTWMNNRLCLVLGGLTSRSWRPHWSVAAEQSTHSDVIDGGSLITHPVLTALCYLETTRLFMCPGVTLKLSVIRFITNKQSIYHKSSYQKYVFWCFWQMREPQCPHACQVSWCKEDPNVGWTIMASYFDEHDCEPTNPEEQYRQNALLELARWGWAHLRHTVMLHVEQ